MKLNFLAILISRNYFSNFANGHSFYLKLFLNWYEYLQDDFFL